MMRVVIALTAWVLLWSGSVFAAPAGETRDSVTFTGTVTWQDFRSYIYHEFVMPEGVREIQVALERQNTKDASLDIGILDPDGLRGWSGGGQPVFKLGRFGASHGYLPGAMTPGTWSVMLAVPRIEQGVSIDYTVTVRFNPEPEQPQQADGGRWLRGDFHVHTGHGDATCERNSGEGRSRCPVFRSVLTALDHDLDFFALSDHNTVSQMVTIAELQPHFDDFLLIPAMEITTFYGHANAFGIRDYVDFRISREEGSMDRLLNDLAAQDAIISVNHPLLHFGSQCMGCGWDVETDYSKVTAVEAVGGGILKFFGTAENPISGLRFWQNLLNQGHRLTAIGGSDNHDPVDPGASQPPIGVPTTVVWSESFTVKGILDGVRSGRVFIDVVGEPDWKIDIQGTVEDQSIPMGGVLMVKPGDRVSISASVAGPTGHVVEFIDNRTPEKPVRVVPAGRPLDGSAQAEFEISEESKWIRAQMRTVDGTVVLCSNPVYFSQP